MATNSSTTREAMARALPKVCSWCASFESQYGWIECPSAVDLIRRMSLWTGERLSHGMCEKCFEFQNKQIEELVSGLAE